MALSTSECAAPWWFIALLGLGVGLTAFPHLDLAAAGLFFDPGAPLNFMMRASAVALGIQSVLHAASLGLGLVLAGGCAAAVIRRHPVAGLAPRALIFLLLALVVGPGLLTNTLFKDNWGRARPLTVTNFGGTARFTPAFVLSDQCDANCSFFSGDAAAVFSLHSLAYVLNRRRGRQVLAASLLAGTAMGVMRMSQGGHFLSDIVFAALFMMLTTALVHGAVFGTRATRTVLCALLRPEPGTPEPDTDAPP